MSVMEDSEYNNEHRYETHVHTYIITGYQYVGFNALGFELHRFYETDHGEERRGSHMWMEVLHTLTFRF